jgi:hypothetical protein
MSLEFLNDESFFYSRREAARIINVDPKVLGSYLDGVCFLVDDFVVDTKVSGKSLTEYQLWVAQTVVELMRLIRSKYQGRAYRLEVKRLVLKHKQKMSKSVWESQLVNISQVS